MKIKEIKKKMSGRRLRYNLSMNPLVVEPFKKLCDGSNMSLSRVFEGVADMFVKSMRVDDNFQEEYSQMLAMYFNYRKNSFVKPQEIPDSKVEL